MRTLIVLIIFSTIAWSQNIDAYQWENRVLIVKGAAEDTELVKKQFNHIMEFKNKLLERKLVLYKCIKSKCAYYDFKEKPRFFKLEKPITNFSLELIGLDGRKKFESKTFEKPQTIFDLIDSMPMRRIELNRAKNE